MQISCYISTLVIQVNAIPQLILLYLLYLHLLFSRELLTKMQTIQLAYGQVFAVTHGVTS